MRDLYEVLGVAEDADDAQLRKAYRKAALEWHPDKNQDRLEEAEQRFKEIQNAYEILGDKHERSWYDSHRDQILRAGSHQAGGGGGSGAGQAQPPDDIFLYQYFSSSCYSGFDDSPKGFYAAYRKVFSKLASAEAEAAERTAARGDRGAAAHVQLPEFPPSQAPWSDVSAFYQSWLHFVSGREFAWADAHNLASAPNRKVRRLMEEDNKKRRKAARKDFQDAVRDLAAFVRKRDPRVAAWRAAEDARKAERAAQEEQRREEERLARLQRAREYQDAAWVQPSTAEGDSGAEEAGEQDGAFLGVPDELYCVACDKFFKSANAMANHERSKKHLENAATLRAAMEHEEQELSPDEASADEHVGEDDEHSGQGGSQSGGAAADGTDEGEEEDVPASSDLDGDAFDDRAGHEREGKEGPEQNGVLGDSCSSSEVEETNGVSGSEGSLDEDAMLARMLQAHARVQQTQRKKQQSTSRRMSSETAASGDTAAAHNAASSQQPHVQEEAGSVTAGTASNSAEPQPSQPTEEASSNGHAAEPRPTPADARHAADGARPPLVEDEAESGQRGQKKAKSRKDRRRAQEAAAAEQGLLCTVCKAQFETRNQLFKHIAAKGHAQLK